MVNIKDIDVFLFDLDGTLCIDKQPIDGALEILKFLSNSKKKIFFITNNSSQTVKEFLDKVNKIGYKANIKQVITSNMVTANYINRFLPNKSVYILGSRKIVKEFRKFKIKSTKIFEKADILVITFDPEINYKKFLHASNLIKNGSFYIATHPDIVCPTLGGYKPDIAGNIAFLEKVNNKLPDLIIGKPYKPMADFIINYFGLKNQKISMIGDCLYTDIEFGLNNNFISILVLTGETKIKDLENSKIKPDYVFADLKEFKKYL